MKIITNGLIRQLALPATQYVAWVRESFLMKHTAQLPPKLSVHPRGSDFFNTMPCLLPEDYGRFGVKVVHRIDGAVPSLGSHILLYSTVSGQLLALLDGDIITSMRTGAVATLAIQTLRNSAAEPVYGLVGLGNTCRATLLCLLESEPLTMHHVALLEYKDQARLFEERFAGYGNVSFTRVESREELARQSDVLVSCITAAHCNFCDDADAYKPGCTIVPVHTRGFQNCDTVFDKVFGDDTGHVCNFRYFNEFRSFAELSDVLAGRKPGRERADERILSYNVGLGLHDVLIASRIYEMVKDMAPEMSMPKETEKFYV